jgi:hypothetical protein
MKTNWIGRLKEKPKLWAWVRATTIKVAYLIELSKA